MSGVTDQYTWHSFITEDAILYGIINVNKTLKKIRSKIKEFVVAFGRHSELTLLVLNSKKFRNNQVKWMAVCALAYGRRRTLSYVFQNSLNVIRHSYELSGCCIIALVKAGFHDAIVATFNIYDLPISFQKLILINRENCPYILRLSV